MQHSAAAAAQARKSPIKIRGIFMAHILADTRSDIETARCPRDWHFIDRVCLGSKFSKCPGSTSGRSSFEHRPVAGDGVAVITRYNRPPLALALAGSGPVHAIFCTD